jgi:hypothetical protein
MAFTGSFTYLQYVRETTFGTAASTIQSAGEQFGFEQKITGWSFTNNKMALSQLGDVRVKTYAYGQTRGSLSIDFVLSSPWFLGLIGFKEAADSCVGGVKTHIWDICTDSATEIIESFTTQIGQEAGGTDIVRTLVGGIANSASISTSIGEVARVSLDSNYKNESLTTSLDSSPATLCVANHTPYTFAHGTLEFPNCTTIAEVQDIDITFNQNADHIWGIGNSTANSGIRRLFEITGKFKAAHTDSVQLQKLYAQQKDTLANTAAGAETLLAEQPTLKLTFTNSVASTGVRSIVFSFSGIALDEISVNIEPNEPIFEDLSFQASDCDVVASDATTATPGTS